MSQVTQLYFLYDSPFGAGKDWEVAVICPNGGNAEFSFDNGNTWLQCNQGYSSTYNGFIYRPPCFGQISTGNPICMPPIASGTVVLGRKVGETDSIKAVFGEWGQNSNSDGYGIAYSAVCNNGNITLNLALHFSTNQNNYQLTQSDTQKLRLSVEGVPANVLTQWVDSGALSQHWMQIFQTVTVPASSFPVEVVFSDVTNTVAPYTSSISFDEPCAIAPNTTTTTTSTSTTTTTLAGTISGFDTYLGGLQAGTSSNDINLANPAVSGGCSFTSYELRTPLVSGVTLTKNGTALNVGDTWTNADNILLVATNGATVGNGHQFTYRVNGSCGFDDAVITYDISAPATTTTTTTTTTSTTTTTVNSTITAVAFNIGAIQSGTSSGDILFPAPILTGGCTHGGSYTYLGGLPSGVTLLKNSSPISTGTTFTNGDLMILQIDNNVAANNYSLNYNVIGNCGVSNAAANFNVTAQPTTTSTSTSTSTTTTTVAPTTTTVGPPVGNNVSVSVIQGGSIALPVDCTVGGSCEITGIIITQGIGCGAILTGGNSYAPTTNTVIPVDSPLTFATGSCSPNTYVISYRCQSDSCGNGLVRTITINVTAASTTTSTTSTTVQQGNCNECQMLQNILTQVLCIKAEVNAIKCKIKDLRTQIIV